MSNEGSEKADFLAVAFRSDYRWLTEKLRFRIGCGFNAEDIASEAFTQMAALPDLLSVREPRAMLSTIANRLLYESWRRRDLERAYLAALASRPEAVHPSPEAQELVMESLMLIDKALDGLSAKAREAFFYSHLDGLTYVQISGKLNVSVSMVRKYIAKALINCYLAAQDMP